MLKVGAQAPDFSAVADDGTTVSLAGLRGKCVVLFFYPRDNTPTCTVEACDFRDSYSALVAAGAVVLGVSPDGVASHMKFRKRFKLPYPLLADTDHAIASAYRAWGEKKLFGITYQGVLRSTFVIDRAGKIAAVFDKVRAKGHAQQVLAALPR